LQQKVLKFYILVVFILEGRLRFNRGHRKNHNAESLEQMLRDPHILMKEKIHLTEGKKKLYRIPLKR